MNQKTMQILSYFLCIFGFLMAIGPSASFAGTTIKVAMITPEGYPWTNALYQMASEIKKKSNGEVIFKIFSGGVSGDESDVIRKMRANRIHAAGFSGVGLGIILPKVRILEAPLLYKSYDEVDYIKKRLSDELSVDFDDKGYVLLGFAEAGFVHFFSKTSMTGPNGFDPLKMWVWKSDPVAKTSLETFGINAIPLHLMDVNTGLETGMINAFYSPPLAAIAFQWHPKIKYMLDYPIVNSTGALIINKRKFSQLSHQNQVLLKDEAAKFCDKLVTIAREDNREALDFLQQNGVIFETPNENQINAFHISAEKIYQNSLGKIYSQELFTKVRKLLVAYRESKNK